MKPGSVNPYANDGGRSLAFNGSRTVTPHGSSASTAQSSPRSSPSLTETRRPPFLAALRRCDARWRAVGLRRRHARPGLQRPHAGLRRASGRAHADARRHPGRAHAGQDVGPGRPDACVRQRARGRAHAGLRRRRGGWPHPRVRRPRGRLDAGRQRERPQPERGDAPRRWRPVVPRRTEQAGTSSLAFEPPLPASTETFFWPPLSRRRRRRTCRPRPTLASRRRPRPARTSRRPRRAPRTMRPTRRRRRDPAWTSGTGWAGVSGRTQTL